MSPGYIKVTPVDFYPGKLGLYNDSPAFLCAHTDGTMSLSVSGEAQPLFWCRPSDVRKFFYTPSSTFLHLRDGRKFRFSMNPGASQRTQDGVLASMGGGALGPIGEVAGDGYLFKTQFDNVRQERANDSYWWVNALRPYGVKTTRLGTGMIYLLSFLGLNFVIMFIGIIVAIAQNV